jgi:hypothetical protein
MKPRPPRPTPEQVEATMVERITDALYPVLIPIEQQDCAIQARNRERVTKAARAAWQSINEVR